MKKNDIVTAQVSTTADTLPCTTTEMPISGQGCSSQVDGPYYKLTLYSPNGDVLSSQWVKPVENLENSIEDSPSTPSSEGETEMAKIINQPVLVNGEKHWITAKTAQEFADKVTKLLGTPQATTGEHPFDAYAWNWYNTYSKPNIESTTAITYKRQLTNHILPAFEGLSVEEITTDHVQALFNAMSGAKATKEKAKMVLNQILDAAVEDKLLASNPLKSRRVKITGKASKTTPTYSVAQMRFLVQNISAVKKPQDRAFLALLCLHPLRLEEVLGLQGQNIDTANKQMHIEQAVTHPERNRPEIKDTKTGLSARTVGLCKTAIPYLPPLEPGQFLLGGSKPLTYTQVRKMCERIKKDTGFSENITSRRFRTTVLTDLYDQTRDIKLTQAAAGHSTPTMTLEHYLEGRGTTETATAALERAYAS